MQQQQMVIDKCKEVVAKAKALYGIDMERVTVAFDLKGRAAGMASMRSGVYKVRFNRDMLTREAFDHVLNDTVPHEFAHILCFMDPRHGKGHDAGWANVCKRLGGSGATRHKEEVVYGNGNTYEYTSTTGHTLRVSSAIHSRIARGSSYTLRDNKGRLNSTCTYVIVGVRGKTLETPVVPKTAPVPVVPTLAPLAPRVSTYYIGAPEVQPVVKTPARPTVVTVPAAFAGASKASIARSIMLAGRNMPYEDVITAIMQATGHDRQLARATYKANAAKVGITL
jgi:predicted SprT family Zn-dependent metalloprotease